VSLVFVPLEDPTTPFVWATAPFFPGLSIRTVITTFPAASWVAVADAFACCAVDAAFPPFPAWEVVALFAAADGAATMLLCVIGPLLPGLFTRTTTTRFTGCCCVAVAVDPAV
jgi:hypothetical protein